MFQSRVLCSSCQKPVQGQYVTVNGGRDAYHPECFRCKLCHRVIPATTSFSVGKAEDGGGFFHPRCYQDVYSPKCEVCDATMRPNAQGVIQYSVTPFWNQKFCAKCHGTKRCFACSRVESHRERHIVLSERLVSGAGASGRRAICVSCAESVVGTTEDVLVIYREIIAFFSKQGVRLPMDLPVHLVETDALNQATNERRNKGHSTMGMTMTEQRQTVRHTMQGNRTSATEVVSTENRVTAILVLYGMPRILFCSVLVHECTHAFLKLESYPKLTLQVEEGLCQLMSYLWLQSQAGDQGSVQTQAQEKERVYHMNKIFEDESIVYGEGEIPNHSLSVSLCVVSDFADFC